MVNNKFGQDMVTHTLIVNGPPEPPMVILTSQTTDSITFTANGDEGDLRTRLSAPSRNRDQALYVSGELKTGRVMVKDEDVCLHCGLCAERCPTGAWDMQKFLLEMTHAGPHCRDKTMRRQPEEASA